MGSLSGDDYIFFDAVEDIASISSDTSTEYDVWVESPQSVQERRSRFLNWMDVMTDENPLHHSTYGVNVISQDSRSANQNHTLSSFPPISIHPTNICDEENRNGNCAEITECSSKTEPINSHIESTRSHMRFRRWLRKPRSFGGATRSESSSAQEGQRVKVNLRGKRLKELSALYQKQTIQAHRGAILSMKFSPDGQFLASAGEDGVTRVWKVVQIEGSHELALPKSDPSCVYFTVNHHSELKPLPTEKNKPSNPRKLKGTDSACVVFPTKVFRIEENPVHEFRGHKAEIVDISWSSNNYLLSASVDKTVRLWRVGCDSCLRVFAHNNYVTCVQFNPVDETHFITGSIDGKVRVWNMHFFQVVDWVDVKDIVTAVSYRKDGNGGIIGSMEGNCRFFSVSDSLQIDGIVPLKSKKKAPCRRITSFQWEDSSKVMVTSADSRIRILNGYELVTKYKSAKSSGSVLSASVTSNKRHIVYASEDSHVYLWSHVEELGFHRGKASTVRSCERFAADAAIAIPWDGFGDACESPSAFSVDQQYFQESGHRCATWPDEKLPAAVVALDSSTMKFVKGSCQNAAVSHAWGMVIVTAGFDGRIKSFQNYGLPVSHLKV